MEFSIILPSRKRLSFLKNLLFSISETCSTKVEVLVAADSDDFLYLEEKDNVRREYPFVKFFFFERKPKVQSYINFLGSQSEGNYIFVLNDDCLLKNYGWDLLALEKLRFAGDLVYGKTNDNSIDKVGDYASFPIISKKAYETLGFVLEEGFGNHGADVITYRIYKDAGLVVDLPMVMIDHIYHSTKAAMRARMMDKTAVEMIGRSLSEGFGVDKLFEYDVSSYVKMLTGAQKVANPADQPRVDVKKVN